MRARVSQAVWKRLDKLDAPIKARYLQGAYARALHHGVPMPPGAETRAQRTVLSWPRIATDLDAWERESSRSQNALIASSAEDRYKPEAVVIEDETAARNAAENERLYQEAKKAAAEGGLSLVRELERRVTRTTH